MSGAPSGTQPAAHTVGVFDSGFGGLTVLRALLPRLPGTRFIYLGDTARLPYGDKSRATVARFAIEAAQFLVGQGAQLLVIACNTATALALPEIRSAVDVPVVGVVEPGARAAQAAVHAGTASPAHATAEDAIHRAAHVVPQPTADADAQPAAQPVTPPAEEGHDRGADVLVLATAATVQSHAYRNTCAVLGLVAAEKPCPLLVPLVEEGWTDHPVTRDVLRIYLREALAAIQPRAVLLGCTHYPLIAAEVESVLRELGSPAVVVDSAQATAEAVCAALGPTPERNAPPATFRCFATDSVHKFARLGTRFLGQEIPEVQLLDLGG